MHALDAKRPQSVRENECVISCTLPYLIIFFTRCCCSSSSSASNWMICFACIECLWMRQCCAFHCCCCLKSPSTSTSTVCASERALSSKFVLFEPCVWDAIWMSFRWPVRCHRHRIAWICFCYYCYRSSNRRIYKKKALDFLRFFLLLVLSILESRAHIHATTHLQNVHTRTQPSPYLNRNLFRINEGNTKFLCCSSCCWSHFSLPMRQTSFQQLQQHSWSKTFFVRTAQSTRIACTFASFSKFPYKQRHHKTEQNAVKRFRKITVSAGEKEWMRKEETKIAS